MPGDGQAFMVIYLEELVSGRSTQGIIPRYLFVEELSGKLVTREGFLWEDNFRLEGGSGGLLGASISSASCESRGRSSRCRSVGRDSGALLEQ